MDQKAKEDSTGLVSSSLLPTVAPLLLFDEDELPISSYDQRKIDNLKNEQDSLQDEIDNLDMSDEDIEKLMKL